METVVLNLSVHFINENFCLVLFSYFLAAKSHAFCCKTIPKSIMGSQS